MSISDVSDAPARDVDKQSQISQQTSHDGSSSQLDGFIPPSELEQQAPNYETSSQSIKEWLKSYEHFQPNTNVSLRFQIDATDYPESAPHTLVPLLTKWLRTWFDRSLKEQQDRTNLVWLLQYTADYLKLGHSQLDTDEIHTLCTTLLHICEEARQHSHLEGCLSVFLAITEIELFPRECLKRTVRILSTAVIILEKPLRRIDLCIKLLAKGDLHDATIDTLQGLLLKLPSAKTEAKEGEDMDLNIFLTPARGAARHLTILINEDTKEEKPVLNIEESLSILKQASSAGILRFATEVLGFLANVVRSKQSSDLFSRPADVTLLFDVFHACKNASFIHDSGDTTAKTKQAREEAQNRERRYRRDHASAVRGFLEALARTLPDMSKDAAQWVWESLRGSLDDLSSASRESALQYVGKYQLCLPENSPDWAQNLFILLDKVVIGRLSLSDAQIEEQFQKDDDPDSTLLREKVRQRALQRIDVIKLCVEAIASAALQNSQEEIDYAAIEPSALDIGIKALKKLLQLTHSERKSEVISILFEELLRLCNIAARLDHPYANIIIETLEKQVLTNARDDHPHGDNFIAATSCIRSIFLQALAKAPAVSNHAFQSLLRIANCQTSKSARCRLVAMALLFRIRSDTSGKVYIDNSDDSTYIASALCKTVESLNAMYGGDDNEEETPRSGSVISRQLWMYPQEATIVTDWNVPEETVVFIKSSRDDASGNDLKIEDWLWVVTTNLQYDSEWETYSYSIVHLGGQLMNMKLFEYSLEILAGLRGFLCGRVRERKAMFEPPKEIGLDKSDVALCFYHILTRLIPYYRLQPANSHMYESGRKGIDLVRAFRAGITGDTYYGTARSCIHALAICCYETPEAIGSEYPGIVEAMTRTVSTPHVVSHILEFLAQVARLPNLHRHFMEEDVRKIFGICIAALKSLMSTESKGPPSIDNKRAIGHIATQKSTAQHTPFRAAMMKEKGLKQYSCALAYHTMIFWFLSIPIGLRAKYVVIITKQLTWTDSNGQSAMDEQTVVLLDLMHRTAFSDLPETARDESFSGDDYETTSYMNGHSVVTIETHKKTGRSQITKRQASGTTNAIYEPRIQQLPSHHDRAYYDELERRGFPDKVQPSHTFLNMVGSAIPVDVSEQPLKLNSSEAYVGRAIRAIDYISTVDSHKVAVTLLKDGQTEESAYLANTEGTKSFNDLLDQIGTRVSLEPPCSFTPFGLLDDVDGKETIAWRDRINEVVFEISTFMPNVANDEYQARKKSHLGNCLVLVVFNQSNEEWKWEYFKSQATLVNIVITPTNRVSKEESSDEFDHEFFEVRVLTAEEYQNISAAAETKVVSKATLAPFVRMLALNENIFSECARNELTGDHEFPSSWRYRMKEIIKLRQTTQSRLAEEEDSLFKQYDFTRWT